MTKPKLAKQNNDGDVRTYAWPPAKGPFDEPEFEVISVTSAKDVYPKPFLLPWAVKMTAEKAVKKYAFLGSMIENDGERGAIDWLKKARWDTTDVKADRGTIVHAALEAFVAGAPLSKETIEDKLDEANVPRALWKGTGGMVEGLMRFLDDKEPEIYWSEQTVFSRKHGYAGTPDLVCKIKVGETRVPAIIDVKTSKSVYDDTALQLVGYARADFVGLPDGTEKPLTPDGAPIEHGIVVRPMAGGTYEDVVFTLSDALFDVFLHCVEIATNMGVVAASRRP